MRPFMHWDWSEVAPHSTFIMYLMNVTIVLCLFQYTSAKVFENHFEGKVIKTVYSIKKYILTKATRVEYFS